MPEAGDLHIRFYTFTIKYIFMHLPIIKNKKKSELKLENSFILFHNSCSLLNSILPYPLILSYFCYLHVSSCYTIPLCTFVYIYTCIILLARCCTWEKTWSHLILNILSPSNFLQINVFIITFGSVISSLLSYAPGYQAMSTTECRPPEKTWRLVSQTGSVVTKHHELPWGRKFLRHEGTLASLNVASLALAALPFSPSPSALLKTIRLYS